MTDKIPKGRPPAHRGLRHVALYVADLEACTHFYTQLLGMQVEWHPDPDNIYLSSGTDNLALHRAPTDSDLAESRLDHIGFILGDIDHVDLWHQFLCEQAVPISKAPKTHRDGARSFYCFDPAGNSVQLIYHPPIADY